jgi:hypothetical protein
MQAWTSRYHSTALRLIWARSNGGCRRAVARVAGLQVVQAAAESEPAVQA